MRRTGTNFLKMASNVFRDGIIAINKPFGHSSAQVIRECQWVFNPSELFRPTMEADLAMRLKKVGPRYTRRKAEKAASKLKMGHGGTLDPLATGVLILGIGSGTKQLSQFIKSTKTYETVLVFGVSTSTYDRTGTVLTRKGYDHVTKELVEKEMANFRGSQMQTPPLYSALKMDGKPLYAYAREGKPIPREIERKRVEVLEIEMLEWYEPGTHNHRWPTQEADAAEINVAEQMWRVKKQQEEGKTLTPEEKEQDDRAIAAHESFKKRFEERQDELIRDAPTKKERRARDSKAMMSGGLGAMPPQPAPFKKRGVDLAPPAPDPSTPPPWTGEGPPACKFRLTVTSGYYVRSFCHDLGIRLGSAAIMTELCRTRQSDFTVGGPNTLDFEDLSKGEEVWAPKVADMLARWNGEPEAMWSLPSETPAADTNAIPNNDNKSSPPSKYYSKHKSSSPRNSAPSSPAREKRQRSPFSDGRSEHSRKAAKFSNSRKSPPTNYKSDGEKSWQGITN
ncbi:hypothetical protein E4U55_001222 [Claviceps digitariae]|nr:hypothetical protein E4U55_001222 [Claviceps digitariae]